LTKLGSSSPSVDEGSFSKAAKKLNRAQSAVTYGIRKLEAQIGLPLFDRAAYRPALTEAGRTLLLRARRIAKETNAFQNCAESSQRIVSRADDRARLHVSDAARGRGAKSVHDEIPQCSTPGYLGYSAAMQQHQLCAT
jgi:DNA-binding transcriptional LysR family regulator